MKSLSRFWSHSFDKVVALVLMIAANLLYYLSLESCTLGNTLKCAELMQSIVEKLVIELIISTLLFNAIILYFLLKMKYVFPIVCALNLTVWYVTNNSIDLELQTAHGYVNMIVSISITSFLISLYFLYGFIKRIIGSHYAFLLYFLCICLLYYSMHIVFNAFDCTNWALGFKSTALNNNISCTIKTPWMCITSTVNGGFRDVTKTLGLSCDAEFQFDSEARRIYKSSDLIFFPDTRKFNSTERVTKYFYDLLIRDLLLINFTDSRYYSNNIINGEYITNKEKIIEYYQSKGLEIAIDLTGSNPRLIQKVVKNLTLIEEAQKRKARIEDDISHGLSNDKMPISKNVMFFFFDSLSRVALKNVLSKTYQFLEKFYDYDGKMESFQFFKYNTIAPNTFRSGFAALLGVNTFEVNEDNQPRENIFDYFRKKGYINSFSGSTCATLPMWYELNHTNYLNYTSQSPFDHENFSLMCDPNFTPGVKVGEYPIDNGVYLPYIRCLYGKHSYQYVLDYASQSMRAYKEFNQFQLVYFSDAHESTNETGKYMDKALHQFLIKHMNQFIKDDWSLIFYTDHGIHFGSNFPDFIQEKTLPYLALLTPRNTANLYKANLKHFENIFITPYDITKLLFSLAGKSVAVTDIRHIDLLDKNSSFDNDCKLSRIDQINCRCFK